MKDGRLAEPRNEEGPPKGPLSPSRKRKDEMNDSASEQPVQQPVDNDELVSPHTWQKAILDDSNLYSNEKLAALTLLSYMAPMQPTAWPSLTTLADKTGLGLSTVKRSLRGLEKHGYIMREPGNPTRSTRYTAVLPGGRPTAGLGPERAGGRPTAGHELSNELSITPLRADQADPSSSAPAAGVAFAPSEAATRIVRFFQEKHQARPDALNVPPKGPLQFRQAERLLKKYPVEELEKIIDWTFQHGWWAGILKSVDHMTKNWEKVVADYRRHAPSENNPYDALKQWEA